MRWYFIVLRRYGVFKGRASRSEFWWFTLFNFIFALLVMLIVGFPLGVLASSNGLSETDIESLIEFPALLYIVATFLPSLGVSIRRLHDSGKSGWWWLLSFVPFGGLVLLFFYAEGSQVGENKYGPPSAVVEALQGKLCPFCKSGIPIDATVCRYCQRDLPPVGP